MVLMDNGKVLVWGENRKYFNKDFGDSISSPTELTTLGHLRIKYVHCFNYRFFVITEEHKVYSWGWNYYDNLGHDMDDNEVMSPTLIDGLSEFDIVGLASSHTNTYFLTSDGKIFFCGMIIQRHTTNWQIQPVLMDTNQKFVELESIRNNCLGLSEHGAVYVFQGKSVNRKTIYESFQEFSGKFSNQLIRPRLMILCNNGGEIHRRG